MRHIRKGVVLTSLFLTLGMATSHSQSRFAGFNSFREQALSDFQDFRTRILEHYADFLDGEWHEFEGILEAESPYTVPKPESLPQLEVMTDTMATDRILRNLPNPKESLYALLGVLSAIPRHFQTKAHDDSDSIYEHKKIDVPESFRSSSIPKTIVDGLGKYQFVRSDAEGKTNYELAILRIPDPKFAFGSFPGQIMAPAPEVAGLINQEEKKMTVSSDRHFEFFGMDAFIPEVDFDIEERLESTNETGKHWKYMDGQKGGKETARQLFGLASQLGLNGYLTLRLTEAYVNQTFKNSNQKARMSAIHYLMSNMGYDIRLINFGDAFTVMMPFDQKIVYGVRNCTIDGRRYTIIIPDGMENPNTVTLSTCQVPNDGLGQTSDLRLTGLNLPMKGKPFEMTYNGLTIKGMANENIRQLLYRYPQMPMGDYASSWIDSDMRQDIVDQIKAQVGGMTDIQAINSLMSLCHYGFDYATDQANHGFEKPYFLEENFIYDKNDCEDRAIFFSYLVWNALGLPCQLIQYPGHESVAVAVNSEVNGYFYNTEGCKYYSSDPTYLGSHIGMIMSEFKQTSPVVDKHYR